MWLFLIVYLLLANIVLAHDESGWRVYTATLFQLCGFMIFTLILERRIKEK